MRYHELICEDLALTISDPYREDPVSIWKNPDPRELRAAFREHRKLRAVIDYNGDVYAWDAELLHDNVPIDGDQILLLPREVRVKWYDDEYGTPQEWQETKKRLVTAWTKLWRAYGRRMPIVADNGEYM